MSFEFATAGRVLFGRGALRQAGVLAKTLGRRALVVTGKQVSRAERLLALLKSEGIHWSLHSFSGEPGIQTVEAGTTLARDQACDFVIGFGGGSAIDAGKAIAAMLNNPGPLPEYLEVVGSGRALERAPAPYLAMPTTAGTGAEVTRNAVLAAPHQRVKVSLRSLLMLPRIALVDPELTCGLSAELTATTGLDALTQLIEPYVCSRASPMTDALCLEGLRRAAKSLRAAYRDGENQAAREDMSLASLFSGLALANAGLGAVHGFAGPIGGMFSAPHGAICAALLPHVMEANIRALRQRQPHNETLSRFETLACLLSGEPDAVAEQAVDWVRKLVADLGVRGLAGYGMSDSDAAEVSEKASKASSMKANPIVLTPEELAGIFRAAL